MNSFIVKNVFAQLYRFSGASSAGLRRLNRNYRNDYIRIINYHDVPQSSAKNFQKQLVWYRKHFENVDYKKLRKFLAGQFHFDEKPGLMITFDDGLEGNYKTAFPLLSQYKLTGWFFVSTGLIGTGGYMNVRQIKTLMKKGHAVGCHTYTHHRMNADDSETVLKKEIYDSKLDLEMMLNSPIEIFCWCGGEEEHYTGQAAEWVRKSGYRYAMMTNSEPVFHNSNRLQLQRTNIESNWNLGLVQFQLSGKMDSRFRAKRERVNLLTQ